MPPKDKSQTPKDEKPKAAPAVDNKGKFGAKDEKPKTAPAPGGKGKSKAKDKKPKKAPAPGNKGKSGAKSRPWSMYPSLHSEVAAATQPTTLQLAFHEADDEKTYTNERDTNVMGLFRCHNEQCPQDGWGSRCVAIRIRMYPGGRYNAKLFHQRCGRCDRVARLVLNRETYVERVSYWLKKWCGVPMEVEKYYPNKKDRPPHQTDRCEGCKVGHCPFSKSVV